MNNSTFYDFAITKARFYQDCLAGDLGRWIFENSKYNADELRKLNRGQWTRYLRLLGHDELSFKALRAAWALYERSKR